MDFYTFANRLATVNGYMSVAEALTLFDAIYTAPPLPKKAHEIALDTLRAVDYVVWSHKIQAIKDVRQACHNAGVECGLLDAKNFVENFIDGYPLNEERGYNV